jgi:hypothetical protein
MKQAVYWLQYDANGTYESEGHIKLNTKLNGTATSTYVLRTPPRVPLQRMLTDVVHDSKLIYRIHALFIWILRTTSSGIIESLFDALPTEEQTIKQERKGKQILLLSDVFEKEYRLGTIIEKTPTNHNDNGYDDDDDDDDDYDSLEYHFSSYGYQALKLFRQFIQKLNNIKHLQYIIYNWIIGNQLIIKYTNRIDNKDYIRAFASVFRVRRKFDTSSLKSRRKRRDSLQQKHNY